MWMIDHFFNETDDGRREGMHEAWTIVSAVAAVTTRVEIGTLVICMPFRNPGLLAKMAATAQEVSAGRIILGLGAGWHEPEFTAFGYPFDRRVDRFAEALPIARRTCCVAEPVTYEGVSPPSCGPRRSSRLRRTTSRSWWRRADRGCCA